MPEPFALQVAPEAAGMRLDQFLADRPELGLTRSHAAKLIKEGRVALDGAPVGKAGTRVRAGQSVVVEVPEPEPLAAEPEALPVEVVYEDADVIVINKPRGMVVHPAPGHIRGTLVNALLARCPDLAAINDVLRPGIVHRLDRDTTGLLVVAKNEPAYHALQRQLKERTIRREYLALVHGQPPDAGTVDAPVGRHPTERKRMAVVPKGRPAVSHFRVLERFPAPGVAAGNAAAGVACGGGYALLSVVLATGRTHQIRVHMAHIGHPVAGDPVYGPRRNPLGLAGQALHARRLVFSHPRTGAVLEFTVPPPPDFAEVLQRLRKNCMSKVDPGGGGFPGQ